MDLRYLPGVLLLIPTGLLLLLGFFGSRLLDLLERLPDEGR